MPSDILAYLTKFACVRINRVVCSHFHSEKEALLFYFGCTVGIVACICYVAFYDTTVLEVHTGLFCGGDCRIITAQRIPFANQVGDTYDCNDCTWEFHQTTSTSNGPTLTEAFCSRHASYDTFSVGDDNRSCDLFYTDETGSDFIGQFLIIDGDVGAGHDAMLDVCEKCVPIISETALPLYLNEFALVNKDVVMIYACSRTWLKIIVQAAILFTTYMAGFMVLMQREKEVEVVGAVDLRLSEFGGFRDTNASPAGFPMGDDDDDPQYPVQRVVFGSEGVVKKDSRNNESRYSPGSLRRQSTYDGGGRKKRAPPPPRASGYGNNNEPRFSVIGVPPSGSGGVGGTRRQSTASRRSRGVSFMSSDASSSIRRGSNNDGGGAARGEAAAAADEEAAVAAAGLAADRKKEAEKRRKAAEEEAERNIPFILQA